MSCVQISAGTTAKWSDICDMRAVDKKSELRLCPKLTDDHFDLPFGKKMRVCLAMQVLSHSVSSAIRTYVDEGVLHVSAKETAAFVEDVDAMSNRLNSLTVSTNSSKAATTKATLHEHLSQLSSLQDWVSGWKFLDQSQSPPQLRKSLPFQKGLKITLAALQQVITELLVIYEFANVPTRRFNQDCVELLFATIRRDRGGFNNHPQAIKAVRSLSLVVCSRIIKPVYGANCEETGDSNLIDIGKSPLLLKSP